MAHCFLQHTTAVELTINDEEIDNPGLILKSKFKQYLPELQENLEIPVNEKQQSIRESFIPKKSIIIILAYDQGLKRCIGNNYNCDCIRTNFSKIKSREC